MNNSDLLVALSLGLAAIIFLYQTDEGFLKIKITKKEKVIFFGILAVIILLCNHAIFERFKLTIYFALGSFFLTPNQWALVLFLLLFGFICYLVFTKKIFNNSPETIKSLIEQYRSEKKLNKLQDLIFLIMQLDD